MSARRALLVGLCVSLLVHLTAGGVLRGVAFEGQPSGEDDAVVIDFDINQAPEPPQADMPEDEPARPAQPEPPETGDDGAETAAEEVAQPPPIEEPKVVAAALFDAGVADAAPDATALAAAEIDAGVPSDATAVSLLDRTDDPGEAVAIAEALFDSDDSAAQEPATPAGTMIVSPADGGVALLSGFDAGRAEVAGETGRKPYPGSDADLVAYFPKGELVTAMIRFDRLRGTEWAEQAEAILAPMPDYRTLVGSRKVSLADIFETFVISSPRPRDATATTLVGRVRLGQAEMRAFIDHPEARVQWSSVRGGILGRRAHSKLVQPGDRRVFLMPFPEWVVLSQPARFGVLLAPSNGPPGRAKLARVPPWLDGLRGIEAESGVDRGPALLVTIAGLLPPVYDVPYMGEAAMPTRLTVALEVTEGGFYVRGTMVFAKSELAAEFARAAERTRGDFVETRVGKAVLSRFNAYHALRGLSLKRNGAKIGYATSVSVADARAMMEQVASWSRTMFLGQPGPAKSTPRPPGGAGGP